jgi:hypothetical protein
MVIVLSPRQLRVPRVTVKGHGPLKLCADFEMGLLDPALRRFQRSCHSRRLP